MPAGPAHPARQLGILIALSDSPQTPSGHGRRSGRRNPQGKATAAFAWLIAPTQITTLLAAIPRALGEVSSSAVPQHRCGTSPISYETVTMICCIALFPSIVLTCTSRPCFFATTANAYQPAIKVQVPNLHLDHQGCTNEQP